MANRVKDESQPPISAAEGAPWPAPVRLEPDLYLAAASRLVKQTEPHRQAAARRLVSGAARHGIDFSLCWATIDSAQGAAKAVVRQAALAVPGSGRTAMFFVSEPMTTGDPGGPSSAEAERAACIEAACEHLKTLRTAGGSPRVRLAQALPEPGEAWFSQALRRAAFVFVGDLAYLRRHLGGPDRAGELDPVKIAWPEGVRVCLVSELNGPSDVNAALMAALDASYEQTLDCPELCGLRETADVLDSHRATGEFDPAMWFLVFAGEEPAGCMLLSRCEDQGSVELVYLGLGPKLRGRGLGSELMSLGVRVSANTGLGELACAVDTRNTPALRVYRQAGFTQFGVRRAMVKPL